MRRGGEVGGGGGQHLKHPDKGKNRKRENLLCVWTIMPLSRRLDRCDRVIQDEVGDSNGGNV